jgi:carbonic anhydrase
VPATEITNTTPGSIFVGRNIANVVVNTDLNLLSVVYYAVKVLKVKHIVVCGHYGCGGVKAAMSNESFGFLDNWLLNLKDVYRSHSKELNAIEEENDRLDRFVELNVLEQVKNLAKISFIQEEWAKGEFPYIHSWVYRLDDGNIKNMNFSINSAEAVEPIYDYESKKES